VSVENELLRGKIARLENGRPLVSWNSMHPLPSGWRTNAGDGSTPKKWISFLKVVAHIHTAMVMAEFQADSGAGGKGAEVFLDALADRFECFEARGFLGSVDADAIGHAMVYGCEDSDGAIAAR
jgi:hypothetical protein